MSEPILLTKLFIPPPRHKTVLRPRLIERLNEGLHGKLILISAPAGFGKTTLVSEWIAGCERPVAWLSLDEGDNDLSRFLSYTIAALQTIKSEIGAELLGALQLPQPPQTDALLTNLLNEITTIPHNFILVLDDYHLIDSQPVDDALAFLIKHQPPHMHLVIASREDPALPLVKLRAGGHLAELRAADLRFTPGEAAEFLNRVMELNLSKEEISALETRTEGWIAGLQLAAISMQGYEDIAGFIQSFTGSHHFVLDYLIEEVLQQQSESSLTFLLHTSILKRMCGPLCDAVLGNTHPSAQQTLERFHRANLFIIPLDNERRWYRYHHLFAELLRQRLGKPAYLADLHLRASAWYETYHDLAEAFQHAIAAADFERAARLTDEAWQGMERNFQTTTWLGWVKKLPHETVYSQPWLCVHIGLAYSDVGELESSETYLQYAEMALAGAKELDGLKSIPMTIALIRAGNAQIEGNLAETVRYAELSLQLIPEGELLIPAQAAITLGFTQWAMGNVEASLQAMLTWVDEMKKLGNLMYVIASAFVTADMQMTLGHLDEAEKALQQTLQMVAALAPEAEVVTAHHYLGLAMLAHERGNDEEKAQLLQKVANLGQLTTLIDWPYRWGLAQASLNESAREWEAALKSLDEAKHGYVKNPIPMLRPVEARKARIHLKQGRLDKAQAWARERGLSVTDQVNYLSEFEHLTLARTRLAEHSFEGVNGLLERLLALAETQNRTGSVIEILLTQALVYQAQGNLHQASLALERALMLAEPEGYIRIFVDEGENMRQLLLNFRSTSEKNAAHSLCLYVDKILAVFPQLEPIKSIPTINEQSLEIIELLTERELQILRLIAEGKSNVEISQRLYLALSTVKGHNLRIFNKLQAQNRTEAVARARELGFL